jgi:ribonuclease H2 subunit C
LLLDETRTTYIRGRKLQGKTASLPADYRGVVLQRKDDKHNAAEQPDVMIVGEDGEDESAAPRIGTMHTVTEFDKMVVWSHDALADASSDPYLRGVEEWLQVASSVSWYMDLDGGPMADLLLYFYRYTHIPQRKVKMRNER